MPDPLTDALWVLRWMEAKQAQDGKHAPIDTQRRVVEYLKKCAGENS